LELLVAWSSARFMLRGPAEAGRVPRRLNLKTAFKTTKETKNTK